MSKLSISDVKKVASLIKINLKEEELEKFLSQLNIVLPSVDVLKELNTDSVKETSQTHGLKNILADDVVRKGLDINKYPNRRNLKNNYFVVNRVIK